MSHQPHLLRASWLLRSSGVRLKRWQFELRTVAPVHAGPQISVTFHPSVADRVKQFICPLQALGFADFHQYDSGHIEASYFPTREAA